MKLETLKDPAVSSMLIVDEQTRRMNDMMKMYAASGMGSEMGFGIGGIGREGRTLVLNAAHPLVKYVLSHEEGDNTKMICEQLYDLALLQNEPLTGDGMTRFVARSNEILMLLTKEQ